MDNVLNNREVAAVSGLSDVQKMHVYGDATSETGTPEEAVIDWVFVSKLCKPI